MKCAGAIFLPECASKRRLLWLFLLADAASDDENNGSCEGTWRSEKKTSVIARGCSTSNVMGEEGKGRINAA